MFVEDITQLSQSYMHHELQRRFKNSKSEKNWGSEEGVGEEKGRGDGLSSVAEET